MTDWRLTITAAGEARDAEGRLLDADGNPTTDTDTHESETAS